MSRHPALTYDAKWTRFVRMWRDVMLGPHAPWRTLGMVRVSSAGHDAGAGCDHAAPLTFAVATHCGGAVIWER
jgi:hypothetical protein